MSSNYNDIDASLANNDYSGTPKYTTEQCRRIFARALDLANGFISESNFSISGNSTSIFKDVVIPSCKPVGGNVVPSTANTGRYNIDVRDLSDHIKMAVNVDDSFLDSSYSYPNGYDSLLKYTLFYLPGVIQELINNIGNKFMIVSDNINISIVIGRENIPHILGFISPNKVADTSENRIITRFYEEIRNEFLNGNNDYMENIKEIISNYRELIFSSIKDSDLVTRYKKELWDKIGAKTTVLKTINGVVKLNDLNQIEIFEAKYKYDNGQFITNDKDTYLLMMKVPNEDNYLSIVVEKDNSSDDYYIKSSCLITNNNYQQLINPNNNQAFEGYVFRKVNPFSNCVVAEGNVSKRIDSLVIRDDMSLFDHHKEYSSGIFDFDSEFDNIRKKISKAIDKKTITDKIKAILQKKLDSNDKKKVFGMYLKYAVVSGNGNKKVDRFYHSLAEIYCADNDILNLIKQCIEKNRQSIEYDVYTSNCTEFNSSLCKNDLLLKMSFSDDTLEYYGPINCFGEDYKKIRRKLESLLDIASNMEIIEKNDFIKFFYLIDTYYNFSMLFNETMNSMISFNSNITRFSIDYLALKMPEMYSELIAVGFLEKTDISDIPVINIRSFDELRSSYEEKNNIQLNEELSCIVDKIYDSLNKNDYNQLNSCTSYLEDAQANYVLYLVELRLLKELTALLNSTSTSLDNEIEINDLRRKIRVVIKSRRKELKKQYIRQYD